MIREKRLFSEDIINIFTDASMSNYNGISCGCSGAICVIKDTIIDSTKQVINNTTNNFTELYAVLLGIELAIKYRDIYNPYKINLYSDSKICISGIREWIFKWENSKVYNKETKSYDYINSSGNVVANQELFMYIVQLIYNNNLDINFLHQNGHIRNTNHSLNKAMNTFLNDNGIQNRVEGNLIKRISHYNNYVDNDTRDYLKNNLSANNPNRLFYNPTYQQCDMEKYIKLINCRREDS